MIYLVMFALSCGLLYLSTRCQGRIKGVAVFVALALPCVLAAFRGLDVGKDVRVYAIYDFQAAQNLTLLELLETYKGIAGVGYILFTWLSVRLTSSFQLYLGALQFAVVIPIYLSSRKLNRGYEWVTFLVYYLLLFPLTLNIMKQAIAAAICYYAFSFLMEGRRSHFVLTVIVASLFHQTAVVFFIVYPCYQVYVGNRASAGVLRGRRQLLFPVALMIALGVVFIAGPQMVRGLSTLKDSYAYQVEHIGAGELNETALVLLIAVLLNSVVYCSKWNAEKEDNVALKNTYVLASLLQVLGLAMMQLDVVAMSLGRFGLYFMLFGGCMFSIQIDRRDRRSSAWFCMVILVYFAYFIYTYLIMRGGQVYPYETWAGIVYL